MPVGIVIASIIGVILMMWIIKRRSAEPPVEFRQDTMRYITLDPDTSKRNRQPPDQTPQAAPAEDVSASAVMEHEPMASRDETPEIQVTPKPVVADAGGDKRADAHLEADNAAPLLVESFDLLVNDER